MRAAGANCFWRIVGSLHWEDVVEGFGYNRVHSPVSADSTGILPKPYETSRFNGILSDHVRNPTDRVISVT